MSDNQTRRIKELEAENAELMDRIREMEGVVEEMEGWILSKYSEQKKSTPTP